MALTQYTADTNIIGSLGTTPEDRPGMTDQQLKDKFDENAVNIKAFLNALIGELASTANGKGASQIGVEDSANRFTAATVEAILAEIAGANRTTETVKSAYDLANGRMTVDGWTPVSDAWTYTSATTITVPSDATTKYKKGDKIKLTQSSTVKYFYIVGVSSTLLSITGGSSYTLANSAISDVSYSHGTNPVGFPEYFATTLPTFTASGTAFTSQPSLNAAKFKIIENVCYYYFAFLSAASGTGTGVWTLAFTAGQLPPMPNHGGGMGMDISNTIFGYSQILSPTSNQIKIAKYDGTTLALNNAYFVAYGSYIF